MPFRDRSDGGRQLGELVAGRLTGPAVVLALPRGGVPVAFQVAQKVTAPLEVLVARKLGAPHQPELGVGAIAEGGALVLNDDVLAALGLTPTDLEGVRAREEDELARRIHRYRGDRELPDLSGKTAVVVDDGLATGVTAEAAVQAVRRLGAAGVILAVPVGAGPTVRRLRPQVDDLVAVESPEDFMAVGMWYRDFTQTSDSEVVDLLQSAAAGGVAADAGAGVPSATRLLADPAGDHTAPGP